MIDSEITTELLRVLRSCGGNPLREDILHTQYNISAITIQTMAALLEHLQHAADKGWVDYVVDEIDREKKWFITPAGKAVLLNR